MDFDTPVRSIMANTGMKKDYTRRKGNKYNPLLQHDVKLSM
jgi:hypothetical protein